MSEQTALSDGQFDYVKFVDEGFAAQTKYANKAGDAYSPEELRRIDELVKIGGPQTFSHFYNANEFRYRKIIEHFGHLLEESVEAAGAGHTLASRESFSATAHGGPVL